MPKSFSVRSRRGSRRKTRSVNPPSQQQFYNGPIVPVGSAAQMVTTPILLSRYTTAVSNGSGIMAGIISGNPSGSLNWSNYVAIYDEYRVLAMEVLYVPNNNDTYSSSLLQAPFVFVWDRDATGGLASYASATDYESCQFRNTGEKVKVHIRMTGSEDAQFVNTSAPTAPFSCFTYASGLTSSTTYGAYFIRYLVQFRGRV